jgi:hypothetical protein
MEIIFARLNKNINKTHSDMKKLILALLVAGTAATANAQEPRSILLYGNVGLHQDRLPSLEKRTDWNATPGIGYQFNHNWTVGVNISWGQNAVKDTAANKTTNNMYAAGAFARYSQYIRRSEIFFWFAQYEFAYQGAYTTQGGNPATNKMSGIYTNLYPALGVNVGRGLALNFSVGGLNYGTMKADGAAYSDNKLNLTFGNQMNFGLSKNFNCGHKMHAHHEPGDEVHHRKIDKMEDEDDAAPKAKKKQRSRDEDE